jgi:hypothetical protein
VLLASGDAPNKRGDGEESLGRNCRPEQTQMLKHLKFSRIHVTTARSATERHSDLKEELFSVPHLEQYPAARGRRGRFRFVSCAGRWVSWPRAGVWELARVRSSSGTPARFAGRQLGRLLAQPRPFDAARRGIGALNPNHPHFAVANSLYSSRESMYEMLTFTPYRSNDRWRNNLSPNSLVG